MIQSKKVLAFGAFDPWHDGHRFFLESAKRLGDYLTVVVARDSSIRAHKGREPFQGEEERLTVVAGQPMVNDARLGNEGTNTYALLRELEFDTIALGYDQQPADAEVREQLDRIGKHHITISRLPAWRPEVYKSSFLR